MAFLLAWSGLLLILAIWMGHTVVVVCAELRRISDALWALHHLKQAEADERRARGLR